MMLRLRTVLATVLVLALTATACNKPSEEDCRKAIANMRRLLETDKTTEASDTESAVRSCRGNSNKKSVDCAIRAQSVDELKACGLVESETTTEKK